MPIIFLLLLQWERFFYGENLELPMHSLSRKVDLDFSGHIFWFIHATQTAAGDELHAYYAAAPILQNLIRQKPGAGL